MNPDPTSLDNLHDLVIPPSIPWWPPAPGWYVLSALLAVAAAWLAWRSWKRWCANGYRRAALRELAKAQDVTAIAELLRRTVLAIMPRSVVASMSGPDWADWLAAQCSDPMPDPVRTQLTSGVYGRRAAEQEIFALRNYAARWIARHCLLPSSRIPPCHEKTFKKRR
jgi:hypothetical protein